MLYSDSEIKISVNLENVDNIIMILRWKIILEKVIFYMSINDIFIQVYPITFKPDKWYNKKKTNYIR